MSTRKLNTKSREQIKMDAVSRSLRLRTQRHKTHLITAESIISEEMLDKEEIVALWEVCTKSLGIPELCEAVEYLADSSLSDAWVLYDLLGKYLYVKREESCKS